MKKIKFAIAALGLLFLSSLCMAQPPRTTCQDIMSFGGVKGGVSYNDTAFAAALAASPTGTTQCVYFPAGVYAFQNTQAITMANGLASLSIVGDGTGMTEIYFPTAATGFSISEQSQLNSIHFANVTITSGSSGASGSAVSITQSGNLSATNNATEQSDFTNVDIRGHDGPNQYNYWNTGVTITNASVFNFTNFKVDGQYKASILPGGYVNTGNGVVVAGSATFIPVQFNFTNANFTYVGNGIVVGNYAQGFQISNSNFTGGNVGILAPNGVAGLAELSVSNSQFNVYSNALNTLTPIGTVQFFGNTLFCGAQANASCVNLASTEGYQIVGNNFYAFNGSNAPFYGISIGANPNSFPGTIIGNAFKNFTGTGSVAITLGASSSLVNVQSNAYYGNATNVTNAGTNNTVGGGSQ